METSVRKGKPVAVKSNGDIVFEFQDPPEKRTFSKDHPRVSAAMRPKKIDDVDAATFPLGGLVLALEVEFSDEDLK